MDSEKRLDRIETRLDSIDANLERHMKRSDALEAQVQPVTNLMMEIKGIVKFFKFLALLIGILEALRMLKFI
jgi:hypothetical protein